MNEKLLLHVSKAEDCFVRYCFDCRAARVAVGPCDGCGADLSDGTAMVGIGLALQQQIKELDAESQRLIMHDNAETLNALRPA